MFQLYESMKQLKEDAIRTYARQILPSRVGLDLAHDLSRLCDSNRFVYFRVNCRKAQGLALSALRGSSTTDPVVCKLEFKLNRVDEHLLLSSLRCPRSGISYSHLVIELDQHHLLLLHGRSFQFPVFLFPLALL